jgi:hypothetical protein
LVYFFLAGAKKDTEPETKLTPATKISGRPVESPKKLVNTAPTRCYSQRARQGTVDSSNLSKKLDKKQKEWDKEIAYSHLVNQQEPGAKLDITMIVQSMKRGKRSARQKRNSSVPWVELLGFNFRNVERARRNNLAVEHLSVQQIQMLLSISVCSNLIHHQNPRSNVVHMQMNMLLTTVVSQSQSQQMTHS